MLPRNVHHEGLNLIKFSYHQLNKLDRKKKKKKTTLGTGANISLQNRGSINSSATKTGRQSLEDVDRNDPLESLSGEKGTNINMEN